MGCIPLGNSSGVKVDYDGKGKNVHIQITNLQNLVINQAMLVQEGNGDPFELYEISKKLGEGAFGEVYRVVNKLNQNIRAMKVINKVKSGMSAEEEKSIINEINVLKTLDHPNILKVYEFFNTKQKFYIITELCTGGELFDRITEVNHFSEKVSSHIMKQLLSAVQFCHSYNVIHRDLKPENILIESCEERTKEFFTIRVIDFGTSEITKKNKMLDKMIGTPYYIAPEVLNNFYNEKCDLWSCGVILYILLSGQPPFSGETDEEIYDKVKEGKVDLTGDLWDEISDPAKDLIKKLLRKDHSARISAQQALNHPWLKKNMKKESSISIINENFKNAIENLKNFNADQKLQQAALAFIVRNLAKKEDIEKSRKIFMDLNEKGDGHLTKDELLKGMVKMMSAQEAKTVVTKLMNIIDVDGNGFIEYEEFLRACLNKESLLTDENLRQAFEIFDKEKLGRITTQEIKKVLCGGNDISDEVWNQILKEIDENGDGEISFKEFKEMMHKIILKK